VKDEYTWKRVSVKRTKEAAEEMKALIRASYPKAQFTLARASDDRYMWHLWTRVDVEDPEEVNALIRDRELDMQVEECIPLQVIVLADRQPQAGTQRAHVNGKTA
jgi:hypothetical protein